MSKTVSGTRSFGQYVARDVIQVAVAEFLQADTGPNTVAISTDHNEVLAIATVSAHILASLMLFKDKPDPSVYLDSFALGLIAESLRQGLDPKTHRLWHDRIVRFTETKNNALTGQTVLDAMQHFLCSSLNTLDNDPASLLFGRIVSIYIIAAQKGDFQLP